MQHNRFIHSKSKDSQVFGKTFRITPVLKLDDTIKYKDHFRVKTQPDLQNSQIVNSSVTKDFLQLCNKDQLDYLGTKRRLKLKIQELNSELSASPKTKVSNNTIKQKKYSQQFSLKNIDSSGMGNNLSSQKLIRLNTQQKNTINTRFFDFKQESMNETQINQFESQMESKPAHKTINETRVKIPISTHFVRVQPIRRYDMVYNIKRIRKIQERREEKIIKDIKNSNNLGNNLIKQENQIQLIEQENRVLGKFKTAGDQLIKLLLTQQSKIDSIVRRITEGG